MPSACPGAGMNQLETCAAQLLHAACVFRAQALQCSSISIISKYAHMSESRLRLSLHAEPSIEWPFPEGHTNSRVALG